MEIRNHFYRISIKALILNESRDKFLIVKEEDGRWELPGGGLDWGATPHQDLPREISEEMGVKVTWIAPHPSYFLTCENSNREIWIANVLYETTLESLDFTPSDECTEVRFVNKDEIDGLDVHANVIILGDMFDPKKHQ
ncbi:NUDIX hydrolase [Candidatus Kaiserbacteria bacterium]|nr:MAG: NUDIX hydrolase [Candidatus Kaiserbacteria bacterium]